MKKLLTLLVAAALVFSFAACSPDEKPEENPPAKTEEKLENTEKTEIPTEDTEKTEPEKTEPEKTEPVSKTQIPAKTEKNRTYSQFFGCHLHFSREMFLRADAGQGSRSQMDGRHLQIAEKMFCLRCNGGRHRLSQI